MRSLFCATLFMFVWVIQLRGQQSAIQPPLWSLEPADSLHRPRLWVALGASTAAYSAAMVGLYNLWYANYPLGRFQTINDYPEWMQMDKAGHLFSAYGESWLVFQGARWIGFRPKPAAWLGFAGGQLIQTSIEVFDGFSEQWGFSWSDVGFNVLGSSLFLSQQLIWNEQRVFIKVSAMPPKFNPAPILASAPAGSSATTTLQQRSDELYGTGPAALLLKNYNAVAIWASVNPRSFSQKDSGWWPRWLNVAVGFGADNMFGPYSNSWQAEPPCPDGKCPSFKTDLVRSRQWFLSLDVDLTRLPVKRRWLKTLFNTINVVKFPAPTLEWNSAGFTRFHIFYF